MTGHSEVTRSTSEQGALFRIAVENGLSPAIFGLRNGVFEEFASSSGLLMQFCVFGFGFFKDGNVGVGVFPKR